MKAWWAKLVLTELGGTVAQWWAQKVLNPSLSVWSLDILPVSVGAAWALQFSPTIKYMHAVLLSSQRPRPEYWQRHKSDPQARHGGRPLVLSLGWVKHGEQRALCIVYSIWPLRKCYSAQCTQPQMWCKQSLNLGCETFWQCVYDFSFIFLVDCLWHNTLNIWPQKSNKSIPESESETVCQIKKSISVQAQLRYSVQQNGLNVRTRWL